MSTVPEDISAASLEAPLRRLLPHWPTVVFRQRADFTFESVTPNVEKLTGLPARAWAQQPGLFWEIVHEADAEEVKQHLQRCAESEGGLTASYRLRRPKTGEVIYLAEYRLAARGPSGRLDGYDGWWLDTTRQVIAEGRLAGAAWKETLAVLTMGLAHDFNNIMAGVLSLSETFLAQIDAKHPFHEGLTLIKQNTQQASQLVHRIMHLHHGRIGTRSYHDLNELTRETVELLHKVIPRRIEVSTKLAPAPLPLYIDPVEFRQVVINLALNAADAMPDRGKLEFETSLHGQLPAWKHSQGTAPRLPSACLSIADNGCGIKAEHLSVIFEPFFTTKAMNRGSGLGLYNARLFVEKHRGAISVESQEGAGATFGIWLPQADFTEAEQAQELANRRRRCVLLAGRSGKSLHSMAEFLRVNTYQVVTATRNVEDVLRAGTWPFDGVIVQVEPKETEHLELVSSLRKAGLPIILQVVGRNQDEIDTQVLAKADLVLTADLSRDAILERLSALFARQKARGA